MFKEWATRLKGMYLIALFTTLIVIISACSGTAAKEYEETPPPYCETADSYVNGYAIAENQAPEIDETLGREPTEDATIPNISAPHYIETIVERVLIHPTPISLEERPALPPLTLQDILITTNTRRHDIVRLDPRDPYLLEIAVANRRSFATRPPIPEERLPCGRITQSAAISDVEFLFGVLRDRYAAYRFLGGDDAFFPVRDAVIYEVSQLESLLPSDLRRILRTHLSTVIVDNHFMLGGVPVTPSIYFYGNEQLMFDRSYDGFRNRSNNLYVVYVERHDIYTLFRLSMDSNGEFFYSPIVMTETRPTTYYIIIMYEDGSGERLELYELRSDNMTRGKCADGMRTRMARAGGIPVITVRAMERFHEATAFMNYATSLREEPVIIIDLRSNGGGIGQSIGRWLRRLTGEYVLTNTLLVFGDDSLISFDTLAHNIRNEMASVVEIDQKLILLVDRYSASAAEVFVDYILNIENALIIGQNTSGTLITGRGTNRRMPNSGIGFSASDFFIIFPEGIFEEEIGFAPDIWVHGDALRATIEMLRNAGLTTH